MIKQPVEELNRIDEELQVIKADGNKKTEEYLEKVDRAKADEEEAKKEVVKAKQDGSVSDYAKAQEKLRNAQDTVESYLDKVEGVKDGPYITKEQYAEYSKSIKDQLDQLNHDKKVRAGELLKELLEIREEVTPVLKKGQEMLHKLQHEILKDKAENVLANGDKFHSEALEDKYNDYTLIKWLEYISIQYPTKQLINYTNKKGNE